MIFGWRMRPICNQMCLWRPSWKKPAETGGTRLYSVSTNKTTSFHYSRDLFILFASEYTKSFKEIKKLGK